MAEMPPVGPSSVARDVLFKLQEEELHNLQCALVENLSEGVLLLDKSGTVIYANKTVEMLLQTSLDSISGKNVRKVLKVQPANKLVAFLRHCRKSAAQDEFLLADKRGKVFTLIISVMQLHLYGRLVFAVILTKNKTQDRYKKLLREKKFIVRRQDMLLKKADEDLDALNFVSSHHLQEPLRKIRSFVNYIMEKEEEHLSLLGREYCARLYKAALRMQLLIADLLAFLGTRKTDFELEKTDLNVLLRGVFYDLSNVLEEKKVSSEIANLPVLKVIPFQIKQLFYHLLSNSLKFSDGEKQVEVKIDCRKIRGVSLKCLQPHLKYYRITFSDNGIGFDPVYAEKIFEVFQRLHTGDEYVGTGIGLAICRRVVENHGGRLIASGEKGKGACFKIYLPEHPEKLLG